MTVSPGFVAGQRLPERRLRGVDRHVGDRGLLARADQEGLLVAAVDEPHRDDHARARDAGVRGGRCADLGLAQQLVQLADPRLHLSLLVLGGVVAAVLLEVALGAGGGDARGDLGTALAGEMEELGIEAVVGILGQPRLGRVAHPKQATSANRDTIGV